MQRAETLRGYRYQLGEGIEKKQAADLGKELEEQKAAMDAKAVPAAADIQVMDCSMLKTCLCRYQLGEGVEKKPAADQGKEVEEQKAAMTARADPSASSQPQQCMRTAEKTGWCRYQLGEGIEKKQAADLGKQVEEQKAAMAAKAEAAKAEPAANEAPAEHVCS